MNYLAHLYLSGNNKHLLIGNFIADGLKAKDKLSLPESILNGVNLHYKIDDFTDSHQIVDLSVSRIYSQYGHYSRVIIDIFYDHFLGINWSKYSKSPLQEFTENSILILKENVQYLPLRSKRFLSYIDRNNTLFEYSKLNGIALVLDHFSHRTKNKSNIEKSIVELKTYYEDFNEDFNSFFPELISFVQDQVESN